MGLVQIAAAAALITCLAHARGSRDSYYIDTFDSPKSLSAWRISGDAVLELGSGYRGNGAALHYHVSRKASVLVVWKGTTKLPKLRNPTISFWARFPGNVRLTLVASDSRGNKLLLPVVPTLEHPHPNEWRYASSLLKGQIATLALSLETQETTIIQGDLFFDEITLHGTDKIVRLNLSELTTQRAPNVAELPLMGVNVHLLRDEPSLDKARAAGFVFVRMDLLWKNVERRGRFRFLAYDLFLRSVESRGMGVLWILDYGHPEHGGDVPRNADDLEAFSHFAKEVARHFRGRNVRYEIWNEPDNPQFWAGSPDPIAYGSLLKRAAAAIRSADPSAIISSGGVSNLDLSFLSRALDPDVMPLLSAISVHPYPKRGPETIVPAFSDMQWRITNQVGGGKEIWDSEWGYSSTLSGPDSSLDGHGARDRERQANLAVREFLTVWSLGFRLGVWYDLRDDGNDPANPEQNYGLLDVNGSEKPAMQAIQILMNKAKSRKFMGLLPEPPHGVHVARLDGLTEGFLVVWTEDPERDTTLELDGRKLSSATDFMGRVVKVKSGSTGFSRISLAEHLGPVYLSFKLARQPESIQTSSRR